VEDVREIISWLVCSLAFFGPHNQQQQSDYHQCSANRNQMPKTNKEGQVNQPPTLEYQGRFGYYRKWNRWRESTFSL